MDVPEKEADADFAVMVEKAERLEQAIVMAWAEGLVFIFRWRNEGEELLSEVLDCCAGFRILPGLFKGWASVAEVAMGVFGVKLTRNGEPELEVGLWVH